MEKLSIANRFSWLLCLSALCMLGVPALADEPVKPTDSTAVRSADAVSILEKAQKAAHEVKTVRFKAVSEPSGVIANFVGPSEGESLMAGWDESLNRPQKFWAKLKTQLPGSEQSSKLTGGGDGDSYFLVDHQTKKGYEDMDPGVLGSGGQALGALGIAEFVQPTPFEKELEAESIELLGKEKVGGEECYKIHVDYGDTQGMEKGVTWSISVEDHLPRQNVRHFSIPQQGDGKLVITLSQLEVDPKYDANLFKMKLPKDYEQIDDFAP